MKPDESAGSSDGFLRRFSAACLKTGEEKAARKDTEPACRDQRLVYSEATLRSVPALGDDNDQLTAELALIIGSLATTFSFMGRKKNREVVLQQEWKSSELESNRHIKQIVVGVVLGADGKLDAIRID